MSAVSIPEVKDALRQMTAEGTQKLVERVLGVATAAEVRAIVSAYMFAISTPVAAKR
jgi:phosphoenolpyruvate-protein kinase (PTS system EI component)